MLEQIRDLTPEAARGWFYFGLPIMGELNHKLDVSNSVSSEPDLRTSLERVAVDARANGIVSGSPGEVVAGAILQSLFRYMLARTCARGEGGVEGHPRHLHARRLRLAEELARHLDTKGRQGEPSIHTREATGRVPVVKSAVGIMGM